MKSWMILAIFVAPSLGLAQTSPSLSSRVEDLLKKKQAKQAQESATIEKIGKDDAIERLEEERRTRIEDLKNKKLTQAFKTRFAPKSPFLNFRPLVNMLTWTSSFHFAKDSYKESSDSIAKESNSSHLYLKNKFEYSWSKKLLIKYQNLLTINQTIKNEKRTVSGVQVTPDPDIGASSFGDHIFELSYRQRREVFYNYDLDYFLKLVYPFGGATRSYAFGSGGENEATDTTASSKGNLKSPFTVKPRVGIDYFSGKKRNRYNLGGSVGYAFKGNYVRNKGTGFWSASPSGLIIKTSSYADFDFWLRYQKRPLVLKRYFFGIGLKAYYSTLQKENLLTIGSDGLGWDQTDKLQPFLKLNGDFWVKYMIKDMEHIEVGLKIFIPYTTKVKRQIIDEGADGGGNRVFTNTQSTFKTKHGLPLEFRFGYSKSF
jgi:hypothetical protein